MSFHRISWLLGGLLGGACAVGCSAEPASATEQGANNEVVGVADLGLIERTFGLELDHNVNGRWTRDATLGGCFKAYASDTTIDYRRYKSGAAFFHALDTSNPERGHDRPVVCVDLDEAGTSLDGVGLDAVFRFNLGKPIGSDAAPGGEVNLMFERGSFHLFVTNSIRGPSPEEVAALRNEHGSKLIDSPLYLTGRLVDLTVKQADVFEPMEGVTVRRDINISGSLAAFGYAAAYKKAGFAYSLARDPLGALAYRAEHGNSGKLRAEQGGDGPGWWQGLYFPVATVSEAGFWEGNETGGSLISTFRMTRASNPGAPYIEQADIKCEGVRFFASAEDTIGITTPVTCTGL